ncbi:SprT family zinc-dependent metalloprotease [Alteromonas gilva]|uniref:SprT family zinc-dependent metalloprotease n=1 Tax=Alteromonas gilva TaxID=2987522 RepID=A0ABT5L1C8_9ALTE|nr:SprT family zinc-dependent metalloprotease [Alteromonas gilva]MDC8830854.1 SprT family zinc-dependent metalloprotease [Alteromonas gilva]
MIDSADKALLSQRLGELYTEANAYFKRHFPLPELTYRRSGRHAGTAFLQQNRINLNPVLLQHNRDAFIGDVLPHEVSHLLVFQLFGRVKPHGKEWQSVMREVFKCAPETRHDFDLSPLKLRTADYECACGPIALSIRRHNAVLRGQKQYICRQCRQQLKPAG